MTDLARRHNRAVFFDRDGTLNVEKGYLHTIEGFEFIPGVPQALKRLQDAGFLLVVVTNQSGVARGFFSIDKVHELHEHMCIELKRYSVDIDGIYFCPHHPTEGFAPYNINCDCRKGKPGMLLKAALDLDIDLSRSFMIGDKMADIEAGVSAGCFSILVRTGYEEIIEPSSGMLCETVSQDLSTAIDYILRKL